VAFSPPIQPATPAQLACGEAVQPRRRAASCHSRPPARPCCPIPCRAFSAKSPQVSPPGAPRRGLLRLHQLLCLGSPSPTYRSGRFFPSSPHPLALLAEADAAPPPDPNQRTRRALALDALRAAAGCAMSAAPSRRWRSFFGNATGASSGQARCPALRWRAGKLDGAPRGARLAEGAYACSDCGRCTVGCPVGLRLDDLWSAGKDELRQRGRAASAGVGQADLRR